MKKEIIDIISNLDDAYYDELKSFGNDIMAFNFLSNEKVNREIYIEKVCDYVEAYMAKNGCKESEIPNTFVDCLLPALSLKVKKKSREEAYLSRAKDLAKEIKKDESVNIDKLKDFARVFVSLYYLKIDEKKFGFALSKGKLDAVIKKLKESKTYKGLFAKGKKISDINVKYNKVVFVDYILELLYLDMLNNKPESEIGE